MFKLQKFYFEMAKERKVFLCTECGFESPKWEGKCPSCKEWNTMVEYKIPKSSKGRPSAGTIVRLDSEPVLLENVEISRKKRWRISDPELERCLGGGMVPGSLVLLAGEPGIGKSTLLLQVSSHFPAKVLYVSGEESNEQIKMRADRMNKKSTELWLLSEVDIRKIHQHVTRVQPDLLILDSIQTTFNPNLEGEPGNISQLRHCTMELQRLAKETGTAVFIIGHVNKEGHIAGPKILEHIVDTVLYFEGDQQYNYRMLRVHKNRFGSTDEIGVYRMQQNGLEIVKDPSMMFANRSAKDLSGCTTAVMIEGGRPFMVEVQALVTPTVYAAPQRSSTGFDLRRLSMLLAVLEKRCGFPLGKQDVFVNIAGGIRVQDPAVDLAVIVALMSSFRNKALSRGICYCAEVGLTGELRTVHRFEQRIKEADRLKFTRIVCSASNEAVARLKNNIKVSPVSNVSELLEILFG